MIKKKLLLYIILAAVFVLPAIRCPLSAVFADTQKAGVQKPIFDYGFAGLKNKISIDLRGMDIVDVLKFLAIEGDLNIVAGKDVAGPVNLLISDVTVGDALEIVLSVNNLAYEIKGRIIKVIPNREYRVLYGVDFYDQKQTVIYQLKYASAKNVGTMLGNVKSSIGKIIFDDSTGTLVLIDTPRKIKEMKEVIEKSELPTITRVLPTQTKTFELKYAKPETIEKALSDVLTLEIGRVTADERTNILLVTDLPHNMEKIERLIKAFDRKTRQVFIEAKIVQVTLSDTFKWGIDWDKLTQFRVDSEGKSRYYTIKPETNLPLNLTGTYNKITVSSLVDNRSFSGMLELLQTVGETKILSNPHIAVEEGKEAVIKVITKQPYSQQTTTTTEAATTTSTEYIFEDVGVTLTVTPRINEDGYINMLIKPAVSSIIDWYPSSTSETRVPVVETANAETTILVKDGTTIILSGMIKDQKTKSVNKVPILGDIPIIGMVFRNCSDAIQRTETIVFLTPRIISGDESYLLQRDMEKAIKGIRE